jgi:hypothetical protein
VSGIGQYIIHGYPIIAHYDLPTPSIEGLRPGRIILVDRGQPQFQNEARYVVSWQGHTDGVWDREWDQGHYFVKLDEATKYFAERCQRGAE